MGKPKELIFLGAKSLGLQCLHYLHQQRERLGVALVAVLTNARGEAIRDYCGAHGLAVWDGLEQLLAHAAVDLLISVQYHKVLGAEHLARARERAVNLHMAPLPEYRGCNQFSFAIRNGDVEFGTTLHEMVASVDAGPILMEDRFAIPTNCWVDELFELTERRSLALFQRAIGDIVMGRVEPVEQERLVATRGCSTHSRGEIEVLRRIDLNQTTEQIERQIRSVSMPGFPPPFAMVAGRRVEFVTTPTTRMSKGDSSS